MSDIRDFFIKTLDEAESGINGMMLRFYRKIKSIDAKVEARLVDQDIKPQYFSFRSVCRSRRALYRSPCVGEPKVNSIVISSFYI